MTGQIFSIRDMSGKGFRLTPVYAAGGPPQKLALDDRLFDPAIDTKTHQPDFIGTIRDQTAFSNWSYGVTDILIPVKLPQSHVYHIPVELAAFREFL